MVNQLIPHFIVYAIVGDFSVPQELQVDGILKRAFWVRGSIPSDDAAIAKTSSANKAHS
jgi:hypothetical protein